jgi:hypothetical protein
MAAPVDIDTVSSKGTGAEKYGASPLIECLALHLPT